MFIAHLPAGYVAAKILEHRWPETQRRNLVIALLIGSVFPDFDMLYFYLVDQGRHLHHHYWTHLPVFWLAVLGVGLCASRVLRPQLVPVTTSFVAGVFLHLILDTPFGGILWLAPFSDQMFHFVTVPASRSWWVWSFVFHWSFAIELAICVAAALLYLSRRRQHRQTM